MQLESLHLECWRLVLLLLLLLRWSLPGQLHRDHRGHLLLQVWFVL